MGKRRDRLSVKEALDILPDNMGEMAQIALAAEMAGVDFADAFDDLAGGRCPIAPPAPSDWKRSKANDARKALRKAKLPVVEFVETHWRVDGRADLWPTTGKWKMLDGSAKGIRVRDLIKALRGGQ